MSNIINLIEDIDNIDENILSNIKIKQIILTSGQQIITEVIGRVKNENKLVVRNTLCIEEFFIDNEEIQSFTPFFLMPDHLNTLHTIYENSIISDIDPSEIITKRYYESVENIATAIQKNEYEEDIAINDSKSKIKKVDGNVTKVDFGKKD